MSAACRFACTINRERSRMAMLTESPDKLTLPPKLAAVARLLDRVAAIAAAGHQ